MTNISFEEFIKDKKVAIVGPAKYLMGSEYGLEIDNHDVVVRINRSIETCDKFEKDVGKRSDVIYNCLIEKPENAGLISVDYFKSKQIKYVCIPPHSSMSGIGQGNNLSSGINRTTFRNVSENFNTRIIDYKLNNKIAKDIHCRPNTGFLAIYDLLSKKPSSLSIYGFSFYLDGFIKGSKSGIDDYDEEKFALKCFNSKRHVQKNLWSYASKTLLDNENVKLDDYLYFILNMKEFSKEEFKKFKRS
jgi:hypothetical protein